MNQEQRDAASRLRADMAKLDALNLPPLTDDEIEDAVQESRRREGSGLWSSPPSCTRTAA